MRVWTIQPYSVWEQVRDRGYADVDRARSCTPDYVPERYLWLVEQLKRRVPGYTGRLPWWGYCTFPDLRRYRYTRPVEPQVRIELEAPQAVSFPIWAWNHVYCGQYLCFTGREHQDWNRRLRRAVRDEDLWPYPEPWKTELERSWELLFDPRLPARKPYDRNGFFTKTRSREAVLERLELEQVRGVTEFMGASRQ